MVNIQHGALRAFEEHRLAIIERAIQQHARIRHQAANVRGNFQILLATGPPFLVDGHTSPG